MRMILLKPITTTIRNLQLSENMVHRYLTLDLTLNMMLTAIKNLSIKMSSLSETTDIERAICDVNT